MFNLYIKGTRSFTKRRIVAFYSTTTLHQDCNRVVCEQLGFFLSFNRFFIRPVPVSGHINMAHGILHVLLVALVATSFATSQKTRKNRDRVAGTIPDNNVDDEIWTFAVGSLGTREAYLDPITTEPKGFYVDVINAVCEEAEKDCRLVYDLYSKCWQNVNGQEVGGDGLFNFHYDACAAWYHTYVRERTFQFSAAMTKNVASGFIVRPGNPDGFDWRDLTDLKIGFVEGFASSPICVAQNADKITGALIPRENIVYYNSLPELFQGVRDGEVDAGFESDVKEPGNLDFLVTEDVYCAIDGISLMARKDNRIVDWWNPAFEKVLSSDKYSDICDNLLEEHGDQPGPLPEDLCIETEASRK